MHLYLKRNVNIKYLQTITYNEMGKIVHLAPAGVEVTSLPLR